VLTIQPAEGVDVSRRWIRLDTTWSQSAWVAELPPTLRLIWIEVLCYVKAHGTDGRAKRIAPHIFASRYVTGITRDDVTQFEQAASDAGALVAEGDEWVVTAWMKYQGDPSNKDRQARYRKDKSRLSPSRLRDVTPVTPRYVTPTETVTETETETETTEEPPVVPLAGDASEGVKRRTRLPDTWGPNEGHRQRAAKEGLNLERECEKFREHHGAKGSRMLSWDQAFTTWLLNAVEFNGRGPRRQAAKNGEHWAMTLPEPT
jgi:hypothetical protein